MLQVSKYAQKKKGSMIKEAQLGQNFVSLGSIKTVHYNTCIFAWTTIDMATYAYMRKYIYRRNDKCLHTIEYLD
jgi:cbb3-type cytochrome oxidase subunit 1